MAKSGGKPGRELLVVRHAKSDWEGDARTDFDRPLAKRGRKDAPRVGEWLRRSGLLPDLVLSSPAKRAKETTLLLLGGMGLEEQVVRWEPHLYGTGLAAHLRVLAECPRQAARVMVVAHNPDLEDLVLHLGGEGTAGAEDGKVLPTAAVARIRMPADWGRLPAGCGTVLSITRPRDLPG